MSKPIKHSGRWRIRWIDEHGQRQSAVHDEFKTAPAAPTPNESAGAFNWTRCIHTSRYVDMYRVLERRAEQLAALGHPARLALLREIVQRGLDGTSTTELQAKLDIPWTTLNHHLDRLIDGGLVATRREGKFAYHTADYKALRALTDFLWEDCCRNGRGAPKECC